MEFENRFADLYVKGVNEFLDYASNNLALSSDIGEEDKKVPSPCNWCNNSRHKTREEIYNDLLLNGIVRSYVRWIYHGEYKPLLKRSRNDLGEGSSDDIFRMIHERFSIGVSNNDVDDDLDEEQQSTEASLPKYTKGTKEARIFENLMRDAHKTLYPGCDEFSKLSFILKLFQIKCMDDMTNKAFTSMLQMFKSALPKGADVPSNYYEARKMITDLGFHYEKIEACEHDCMLFWKENVDLEKCSICASDGFNPFGGLRSDYSIWPVFLVVYNLPPWMCMKQSYNILSLLIPEKSGPDNNIDVYLQPSIEELKELWEMGAMTYDASQNSYFHMLVALLWTINDFPAYANLSGWSTKVYKACPRCMNEASSIRLPNQGSYCYMDTRRFLPTDHKWRFSESLNGRIETRGPPKKTSGTDILTQVRDLEDMKFGKK
ncbi:uncharacterized protein LOC104885382 [Beta vulgaris subsp. vulgaris]|uniref:uncharacterized protein LOC104885382 n=1 Tax=Beta vulgaris subsp. vulgaris TaxID=3555 RepID=UPI002547C763|nr:uncharacterized protein LOC104885382 [Beta vulgaris subsp. vulgaris]